jgi:hypothetical protein
MDAERSGGPMNDTAIDREIQAALALDPSPEFVARVRTRIAAEPARATPWLSWKVVAAAALAAAMVATLVVSRQRGNPSPFAQAPKGEGIPLAPRAAIEPPRRAQTPVTPRGPAVSGPSSAGPSRFSSRDGFPPPLRSLRAELRRAGSRARRVATVRAEPEILLDPGETRALRRLIAGTREGTLDLSASLEATTPTAMDLPPIDALVIAPLTIDPLTPSGEEGVRP